MTRSSPAHSGRWPKGRLQIDEPQAASGRRVAPARKREPQRPPVGDAGGGRPRHRLPIFIGVAWGELALGLAGSLGGLVFLHLPATRRPHHMAWLMACAFGMTASHALGLLGHLVPPLVVPLLVVISLLVVAAGCARAAAGSAVMGASELPDHHSKRVVARGVDAPVAAHPRDGARPALVPGHRPVATGALGRGPALMTPAL